MPNQDGHVLPVSLRPSRYRLPCPDHNKTLDGAIYLIQQWMHPKWRLFVRPWDLVSEQMFCLRSSESTFTMRWKQWLLLPVTCVGASSHTDAIFRLKWPPQKITSVHGFLSAENLACLTAWNHGCRCVVHCSDSATSLTALCSPMSPRRAPLKQNGNWMIPVCAPYRDLYLQ